MATSFSLEPHFCKTVSFALIWWDQTVDSGSTWCSLAVRQVLPRRVATQTVGIQPVLMHGVTLSRCRNLVKFLLVQLARFSRPVWTEAPSTSVPATLHLLSSTDLQNLHFVSLPAFMSMLLMKVLNNMGPSINPLDIQFLPIATDMSSHWLLPFTSSSPRDLNPFATTRHA